ncbi:hypothetical protein GCM10010460_16130 [Microbacterium terrae]|nr:hypothetical protein GCM10017594_13110 [Microbacterium terrae]
MTGVADAVAADPVAWIAAAPTRTIAGPPIGLSSAGLLLVGLLLAGLLRAGERRVRVGLVRVGLVRARWERAACGIGSHPFGVVCPGSGDPTRPTGTTSALTRRSPVTDERRTAFSSRSTCPRSRQAA